MGRLRSWWSLVLPVVLLSLSLPLLAQRITGDISGTITDESGAAVNGATVRAENINTGEKASAASGEFVQAEVGGMNAKRWNACKDPVAMLRLLRERGLLTERKARLFGCACCRQAWPLFADATGVAVDIESANGGRAGGGL